MTSILTKSGSRNNPGLVVSMHKSTGEKGKNTYSTCFDHSGGSLKVMNIQLVKIVHIMIMLKRVCQLRKIRVSGTYSITST